MMCHPASPREDLRFSALPQLSPRSACGSPRPRMPRGIVLRQIGDGTYLPMQQLGRPWTTSDIRHPLLHAAAPDNEICLEEILSRKLCMKVYDGTTSKLAIEVRLRMEAAEAARRERQRLLNEKNAARAELLRRIADKDARMLAQEKKEARRLKREARRAYLARCREVGDTTKRDPFAWMPKKEESDQQDDGSPQVDVQERVSIPQPVWLNRPIA